MCQTVTPNKPQIHPEPQTLTKPSKPYPFKFDPHIRDVRSSNHYTPWKPRETNQLQDCRSGRTTFSSQGQRCPRLWYSLQPCFAGESAHARQWPSQSRSSGRCERVWVCDVLSMLCAVLCNVLAWVPRTRKVKWKWYWVDKTAWSLKIGSMNVVQSMQKITGKWTPFFAIWFSIQTKRSENGHFPDDALFLHWNWYFESWFVMKSVFEKHIPESVLCVPPRTTTDDFLETKIIGTKCAIWIGLMIAGSGATRKTFPYFTDPSGLETQYLRIYQGHSGRNPIVHRTMDWEEFLRVHLP